MKTFLRMVLFFGVLFFAALDADAATTCETSFSGMVSWWQGEDNTNDSAGVNNGTFPVNTYADGKVGRAFSFDGVYGVIGNYVGVNLVSTAADNITMDAWINWGGPNANNSVQRIFYNGNSGSGGYGIYVGNDGTLSVLMGAVVWNYTASQLSIGTWYHVAAVRDNGIWKIYLDGTALNGNNDNISPNIPSGDASIGGSNYANDMFKGLIDEVAFFNRALSAAEIAAIYNAGSTGKCTDTTPANFLFIDQTGVELNSVLVSNAITVSGINAATDISITGGEYAVSTDSGSNWGIWTATAGSVNNGNQVMIRQTSSAGYLTPTNAVLTIGGVGDTFSVTTLRNGDVNADNNVNIVDALFVARYAAGLSVSGFKTTVADVNCLNSINIVDALLIARKAAGLAVADWCQK